MLFFKFRRILKPIQEDKSVRTKGTLKGLEYFNSVLITQVGVDRNDHDKRPHRELIFGT